MNRREFLNVLGMAPFVAPAALAAAEAAVKYAEIRARFAEKLKAATETLLSPMRAQPCAAFWANYKIVTPTEVRLLYPDSPAALPIEKRKSSRAFWLCNPERDPG